MPNLSTSCSGRVGVGRMSTRVALAVIALLNKLLQSHGYANLSALDEWERGRMVPASLPGALIELGGNLGVRRA